MEKKQQDKPLDVVVFSDYICPWCYVASYRLTQIKAEYQDNINIIWKSFILRLNATAPRHPVSQSNRGRERAGEMEPALTFHLWPEDRPMPLSSLPALQAAKAARAQGQGAFYRMHELLFRAYFIENRNISDNAVLEEIACQAELNLAQFREVIALPATQEEVMQEYEEAVNKYDINGVPTIIFRGYPLTGAVDIEVYRQAIEQLRKKK